MAPSRPRTRTRKSEPSNGTTLHSFFSKNGTSRKREAENQDNGGSTRSSKRIITRRATSEQQPLRVLESDTERRATSTTTTSAAAVVRLEEPESLTQETLGLVRIRRAEDVPDCLTARKEDAQLLHAGAILGRNASKKIKSRTGDKIDLGISSTVVGVSRKHLQIAALEPGRVTLQPLPVPNAAAIYRYNHSSKNMERKAQPLDTSDAVTLVPGDVIEFDFYNRDDSRPLDPEHVFRVVTVTDAGSRESSNVALFNTPQPADEEQTRDETMVDAGAATNVMESTATNLETPEGDSSSFYTARESAESLNETPLEAAQDTTAALEGAAACETGNPPATRTTLDDSNLADKAAAINESRPSTADSTVEFSSKAVQDAAQLIDEEPESMEEVAKYDDGLVEVAPSRVQTRTHRAVTDSSVPEDSVGTSASNATVRVPRKGDRFRVQYAQKHDSDIDLLNLRSIAWYFGTAMKVTPKRHSRSADKEWNIEIEYDDKSTDSITYPGPDVQILTVDGDKAFVETQDGKRSLAYERNMENLAVGDLVDCRYLAGGSNGGAYYRGRIAVIDTKKGTCDVAYFDKEYERGVPIDGLNLVIVERGLSNFSWLEGLYVPSDFRKKSKALSRTLGRVVMFGTAETGQEEGSHPAADDLIVKIKFKGGRVDAGTYDEIVPAIFAHVIRSTKVDQIKKWPEEPPPRKAKKAVAPKKPEKTNPIAFRRRIHIIAEDIPPRDESDSGLAAFVDEVNSEEQATDRPHFPPSKEIHVSISHSFAGALKSAQPHLGFELLTHALSAHNSIPNATLAKTLYDMVVFGPKLERTYYPDPHKVQLTYNYLSLLRSNPTMMKTLGEVGPSEWHDFEDALGQVTANIYRNPGDKSKATDAALSRISNSLQVAANGLSFIGLLMEDQLGPAIHDPSKIDEHKNQPIVRALRDCDGGVHEALKHVIRMNVQAWATFGHFVLDDLASLSSQDNRPSQAVIQACQKQATRVFEALGKISCYTVWLYSIQEGVRMDTKKLALVITDVLHTVLSTNTVDANPYDQPKKNQKKAAMSAYSEKVKLRFTQCLEEEFAAPMQSKVADLLGLHKKYSFLF